MNIDMKIMLICLLILAAVLGVSNYVSYVTGKNVQRAEDQLALATAPRDTIWEPYEVKVPAVEGTITGKPKPHLPPEYKNKIDSAIAKAAAAEAAADSMEALVWTIAAPFEGEQKAEGVTIKATAWPINRRIDFSIKFDPIKTDVPVITIKVPVPVEEPWYEDPLYFILGAIIGGGAVMIAK